MNISSVDLKQQLSGKSSVNIIDVREELEYPIINKTLCIKTLLNNNRLLITVRLITEYYLSFV